MPHSPIHHVVLDIEGTTCPVEYVSEVLFPYADHHLAGFLSTHGHDPNVATLVKQIKEAWKQDTDPSAQALRQCEADTRHEAMDNQSSASIQASSLTVSPLDDLERVVVYLQWLIQQDRKLPALKELQGLIWEDGYRSGLLQGPLFADVAPALKRWQEAGLILSVYSSGSRKAQQLLYQYSNAGDLRPLFKHWFDTKIGSKLEPNSYEQICKHLASPPADVLFISDSLAELQAANHAGLTVLHSDRSQHSNPTQDTGGFSSIRSFSNLDPNNAPL